LKNNTKAGGSSAASTGANPRLDPTGKKADKRKHSLRAGDPCPQCTQGALDYDGLLNLSCLQCGYALSGCFT
jgi:hypothetical protein